MLIINTFINLIQEKFMLMKKMTLLMVGFCAFMNAQFTSPNNGTNYTLTSLSAAAPTVLVKNGSSYTMTADITISANDKLTIDENATMLVDAGKALFVYGGYNTTATNFVVSASDIASPFKGIQFEIGSLVEMKNTTVEYGGGVRVLTDNFLMDNCIIRKNTTGVATNGAVSLFRGSPVIKNSQFIENSRSGIASGTSSGVSVTIENNYLFGNNTANANSPQINIGMSISDSVKIINNTVIGNRSLTKVGGIGVSMLTGGSTRFRIEGNTVRDNRYGVTTIGGGASGIIKNNILENNDAEINPNDGGSGISVYAAQNIIIRNNQIRGNLWGVTVLSGGTLDLGTESDQGNNIFKNNANNGNTVAFFNNTPNQVNAVGNCWREDEASTDAMVEAVIGSLNPNTVSYKPYNCAALAVSDVSKSAVKIFPNPSKNHFFMETENAGNIVIQDMSGKVVFSSIVNKGRNEIKTNLQSGIYIITHHAEGQKSNTKLIIK